jgi:hypothetical protein
VQAISSGPLPSSLLFRAFVWATWAHTAAQKRCSSDLSDETLCRWNDVFHPIEGESMNRLLILGILIISTAPLFAQA